MRQHDNSNYLHSKTATTPIDLDWLDEGDDCQDCNYPHAKPSDPNYIKCGVQGCNKAPIHGYKEDEDGFRSDEHFTNCYEHLGDFDKNNVDRDEENAYAQEHDF